jgi:hypothetical protein
LLFKGDCNGLERERAIIQKAKVIVIQIPAQPEPPQCLGTNSKSLQFHSGSDNIRGDIRQSLAAIRYLDSVRLAPSLSLSSTTRKPSKLVASHLSRGRMK